jgi:hypothetical protein
LDLQNSIEGIELSLQFSIVFIAVALYSVELIFGFGGIWRGGWQRFVFICASLFADIARSTISINAGHFYIQR